MCAPHLYLLPACLPLTSCAPLTCACCLSACPSPHVYPSPACLPARLQGSTIRQQAQQQAAQQAGSPAALTLRCVSMSGGQLDMQQQLRACSSVTSGLGMDGSDLSYCRSAPLPTVTTAVHPSSGPLPRLSGMLLPHIFKLDRGGAGKAASGNDAAAAQQPQQPQQPQPPKVGRIWGRKLR